MPNKSRAEYFRERRKTRKQFIVMLEKDVLEEFDRKIKLHGTTRADWLRKKIEEELMGSTQ